MSDKFEPSTEEKLEFADALGRELTKEAGMKEWLENLVFQAVRKGVKKEISSRAPHARKALSNIGRGAGGGAAVGAGAGAISGASSKDTSEPKAKKILRRAIGGAMAGGAIGAVGGGIASRDSIKKVVDFNKAASVELLQTALLKEAAAAGGLMAAIKGIGAAAAPVAQKAVGNVTSKAVRNTHLGNVGVGAAVGAGLGAGKHIMSNDPNSTMLGSMAGGAMLGAGAGRAAKPIMMRAGAQQGVLGNYVRGGMGMAGDARGAGLLNRAGNGSLRSAHTSGFSNSAPGTVPAPNPRANFVQKYNDKVRSGEAKAAPNNRKPETFKPQDQNWKPRDGKHVQEIKVTKTTKGGDGQVKQSSVLRAIPLMKGMPKLRKANQAGSLAADYASKSRAAAGTVASPGRATQPAWGATPAIANKGPAKPMASTPWGSIEKTPMPAATATKPGVTMPIPKLKNRLPQG